MLTEALLSAAAEAVFAHLIEQSGVTEKTFALFKRPNAVQVAFQTALARSYSQFLETPHAWAAATFFDEHFLKERAAPLLAQTLSRDGGPEPSVLAERWAEQFTMRGQTRDYWLSKLQLAATEFLRIFRSELRSSEHLRPFFDSQDLTSAVSYLQALDQNSQLLVQTLEQLSADLHRVLNQTRDQYYELFIRQFPNPSIINATASDANQVFVNGTVFFDRIKFASPTIASKIYNFEMDIAKRTEEFVGRTFVFAKIDQLLQSQEFHSGYIVISGEPGIGKTALCGQLVKQLGCVHHFNIANRGVNSPQAFLENVCAQLIIRFGLEDKFPELEARATRDGNFLLELLDLSSRRASGNPVIIVVDALDEAQPTGSNRTPIPLYLPQYLPDGVCFVVSRRPVKPEEDTLRVDNRHLIELHSTDERNLQDVRLYVRNFVHKRRSAMVQKISQWKINEATFVDTICDHSEGNFMYAKIVLEAIYRDNFSVSDLSDIRHLPVGLKGYYQQHIELMRNRDAAYDDIVCTLATMQMPMSVPEISAFTAIEERAVKRCLDQWREFFDLITDRHGVDRYTLYHRSFQQYLERVEGCVDSRRKKLADIAGVLFEQENPAPLPWWRRLFKR